MKTVLLYFCSLALVCVTGNVHSQISWDFTTEMPTTSTEDITSFTAGAITQGNNNGSTTMLTSSSVSSGYTGASGGNNAGLAARTGGFSTDNSAYFQVELNPVTAMSVNVVGVSFGVRSTGTGPQNLVVKSSKDNYVSDLASSAIINNSEWGYFSSPAFSIIGEADEIITLRIYFFNGTGSPNAGTANLRIDDLKIHASLETLPVSVANFTANPINNSILLNWQTLSEQNNKHFEIERSADGEIFASIATVDGAGTSIEVKDYSYTDYTPLAGLNYYRLLQQDFNGTTTVIKTIVVDSRLKANQLSVFTTASGVNVDLNAERNGEATIAVYNFNGAKIAERSLLLEAGLNNVALEADLLPGLYFVEVLANNEVSTVKFAK